MINSAKGRLVAFDNKKNLELIGLIFEADGGDKENIIIHVHGNYGNFYNKNFRLSLKAPEIRAFRRI